MRAPLARLLRAWPWLLGLVVVAGGVGLWRSRTAPPPTPAAVARPTAPRAVAALGRLEPAGDVRRLAAPMTGFGSPRITELLVEEGQAVRQGQLLARFDNGPVLAAERRLLETRIANLQRRLAIQERDISRYRTLARQGAFPSGSLDARETDLLKLVGERNEAQAQLARVTADLVNTELRAPIDGTVLRLHARVGERPTDADGILEMGASDRMEALLEVYESDIDRVRLNQKVELTSENGGFDGSLSGRVVRISPQVRQREVLSTDPTGDADARIVEVRVALDPAGRARVRDLTGLKVIARFSS